VHFKYNYGIDLLSRLPWTSLAFEPQSSATWPSSADYEVYIDSKQTYTFNVKLGKLENVGYGNRVDEDLLEASYVHQGRLHYYART